MEILYYLNYLPQMEHISLVRVISYILYNKVPYVAGIVEDREGKRATLIEGYKVGMEIKIGTEVFYSYNDKAVDIIG